MKVKLFIYSVTGCANFRLITSNSWFNELINWQWLLISWFNAELLVAASTSCLALLLMILEAVTETFFSFSKKTFQKLKDVTYNMRCHFPKGDKDVARGNFVNFLCTYWFILKTAT